MILISTFLLTMLVYRQLFGNEKGRVLNVADTGKATSSVGSSQPRPPTMMEKMHAQMGARMERRYDPPTPPASSPWGNRSFAQTATPACSPTQEERTPTPIPHQVMRTRSSAHGSRVQQPHRLEQTPLPRPCSVDHEAPYTPVSPRVARRLRRLVEYSPSPARPDGASGAGEEIPRHKPKGTIRIRSPPISEESELTDMPPTPAASKKKAGTERLSAKAKGKKRATDELEDDEDDGTCTSTRRSSKRRRN